MSHSYSHSHRAVTALCMLSIVNFLENYMRTLISVSIIPFLDYDSYNYSLLSGTFFAVMYTCGGLFFSLSPTLHSKRVLSIAVACFVFSLATFATALSSSVWVLVLIRMIMGLGQSVVTPFASGIIGAYFSYESRGIAFSIFNFGTYASFSLSLSLGTFMYDEYGWKSGYLFFGVLGMVVGLVLPLVTTDNLSDTTAAASLSSDEEEVSTPLLLTGGSSSNNSPPSDGSFYEIEEEDNEGFTVIHYQSTSPSPDAGKTRKKIEKQEERVFSTPQKCSSEIFLRPKGKRTTSSSTSSTIIHSLKAVLRCWWRHPLLIVICLATGIRLGAGYIWTSYTAVYFSELYLVEDRDDDCLYSNPSVEAVELAMNSLTTSTNYIPVMGQEQQVKQSPQQVRTLTSSLNAGSTCGTDYPYCFSVEAECRKLNDYPWHNEGMEHIHLQEYMSWVPLIGSGLGSLVGGHVSDKMYSLFGLKGRPFVAGLSSLISIPFVVMALVSGFPSCFLYFIPSGLTGEMYIAASLALVADLTPPHLLVPSTALFMFFVTIIAGNCPLLVPLGLNSVIRKSYHTFTINAAPVATSIAQLSSDISSSDSDGSRSGSSESFGVSASVQYLATERSGDDLKQVMIFTICALYALSSVIYFLVMLLCPPASINDSEEEEEESLDREGRGGDEVAAKIAGDHILQNQGSLNQRQKYEAVNH